MSLAIPHIKWVRLWGFSPDGPSRNDSLHLGWPWEGEARAGSSNLRTDLTLRFKGTTEKKGGALCLGFNKVPL